MAAEEDSRNRVKAAEEARALREREVHAAEARQAELIAIQLLPGGRLLIEMANRSDAPVIHLRLRVTLVAYSVVEVVFWLSRLDPAEQGGPTVVDASELGMMDVDGKWLSSVETDKVTKLISPRLVAVPFLQQAEFTDAGGRKWRRDFFDGGALTRA